MAKKKKELQDEIEVREDALDGLDEERKLPEEPKEVPIEEETHEETEEKIEFEVIYAVVNSGFADQAMVAAKEAGAHSGTIIHARGTSNIGVDKKYGLTMSPDKEILMILTTTKDRDAIANAIYTASIKKNNHKGIIFSLPVTSTTGLKMEKYK